MSKKTKTEGVYSILNKIKLEAVDVKGGSLPMTFPALPPPR